MLDGLICSVVAHNMLIDCFVEAEMMEKALESLVDTVGKGFSPNPIIH